MITNAVSPDLVYVRVLQQLRRIPTIMIPGNLEGNVFDGYVPEKIPEDASGFIKPYVVLFANPGTDIYEDRALSLTVDYTGSRFTFQTTIAGASAEQVRGLAHDVKLYLAGYRIGQGSISPIDEQQRAAMPMLDDRVTPARLFIPLQWEIATTTH